jgi:hypothetical protein
MLLFLEALPPAPVSANNSIARETLYQVVVKTISYPVSKQQSLQLSETIPKSEVGNLAN